jgi:adenine-specific DNA methylase
LSAGEKFGLNELLISGWFPIEEVSVESVRERSTSQVPGVTSLHVWFARRPLATSRAAIVCSLIPSVTDLSRVLEILGIPKNVNIRKAQEEIIRAKAIGLKLSESPFKWARAFTHTPSAREIDWFQSRLKEVWFSEKCTVVDPMAGGGSIPYEAIRLGLPVIAGDLNPIAFICLKGTLEYPTRFGKGLIQTVENFCMDIHRAANKELEEFYPRAPGEKVYAYLWARTIQCSSCGLAIPLSPNWWLMRGKGDKTKSIGVKIMPPEHGNECSFEIVSNPLGLGLDPDKGTAKGGQAECPRCHTVMSSEYVKTEAERGKMGHQLYAVFIKNKGAGKGRAERTFRAPRSEELEAIRRAEEKLRERLSAWEMKQIVPNENFPKDANDTRPLQYGMRRWCDLYNPRQLLAHLTYLEKFLKAKENILHGVQKSSEDYEFAVAIATYGAMVFDRCIVNNCLLSLWNINRTAVAHAMGLQGFPFKSSYAEWDHSRMLWPWAQSKVLDALKEIIELLPENPELPSIYCGTATKIPLKDKSVPCIVVDPPYAENVMYGEISDFFYVWLKRLLGDIFPDAFKSTLTEKEEEAIANPARFKGIGKSAKKLAQEDYKTKMEACFREMHRILQDKGVMTVMFTHRTAEAWSSLATALMNADFTFISSWPVHTEPSEKYGKRGKGVLKITVLLTCRKRQANHPGIWEHIIEELRDIAKQKIEEFSKLGIEGPDLKVSVYGPVLGKFADYYPVKTATGKEIDPLQALDLVTDVLNEKFLQEAGIQTEDRETAAYINLLATFPHTETEYEEARLATVFGGLVTLDTLDTKGTYGLIEKKGKNIKILSARDRLAKGIIDPYDMKTLKTMIDNVHAAILLYEKGGLIAVKQLLRDKNLDYGGSPFPTVLEAYARYADASFNDNFRKDASMAKALLAALGKSIEFAPRKKERLDTYFRES